MFKQISSFIFQVKMKGQATLPLEIRYVVSFCRMTTVHAVWVITESHIVCTYSKKQFLTSVNIKVFERPFFFRTTQYSTVLRLGQL